ncbi:MAG: hypothetical protein Kow002_08220 [Anaerolineales bacterium]
MKQDRFLIGILVGIGVLIAIALTLFFTRQDTQAYMSDDTPEGVVHNYALAVFNGDYQKAYGYLAEKERKPTYEQFRTPFLNHYVSPNSVGLEIGETKFDGNEAFVTVYVIYNPSDPFSSSYRGQEIAHLVQQSGDWKILQMPYNLWYYDWYQIPPHELNPAPVY